MPQDLFRRLNLDLLWPPFLLVVLDVVAACRARGHDYWATYGLRTFAEQEALHAAWLAYRAGRGPQAGQAAPAGLSAHQYGIAADFVADADEARPGLQPDWTHPAYDVLGEEVRARGLVWGRSFRDDPHVQWPGYVTGRQLEPLLGLVKLHGEAEGRARVWRLLDAECLSEAWRAANPRLAATLRRLDAFPLTPRAA